MATSFWIVELETGWISRDHRTWTQEDLQIDWRVGADWFEVRIAVGPYEMAKDGKGLEWDVKEVLKTLKTYNYIQFP